jgi:hypothetical protein
MLPNIIKIKIVREFLYCLAELHDVEHTIYCDILFTSTQQEQELVLVLANRAKRTRPVCPPKQGNVPFFATAGFTGSRSLTRKFILNYFKIWKNEFNERTIFF